MTLPIIEKLKIIVQTIYDKKGFNILILDISGLSTMTDYMIIAEGNVERHVQAIYRELLETLAKIGFEPFHHEGESTGDWIVIDYGFVMVHLFIPEMRERYALEELWSDGEIVDIEIKVTPEQRM